MKRFTLPAVAALLTILLSSCVTRETRDPRRDGRGGFTEEQHTTTERTERIITEPRDPSPTTTTEETTVITTPPEAPTGPVGEIQYGVKVPGKPGYVTSPHAPTQGYVDVRGYPLGTEVQCPFSGKVFLVP